MSEETGEVETAGAALLILKCRRTFRCPPGNQRLSESRALGNPLLCGRKKLESERVLHEALLMSVLLYDSETMIWREKQMSRISFAQMDNLGGLLGIMRMDGELHRVMK